MIAQQIFGRTKDGREVIAFTLRDGASHVTILNYGGIIQSIVIPDKHGNPTDVVLGYNTLADYENNDGYLGALIGRFGNRIDQGKLTIDGKQYALCCNKNGNHLHGGKVGFNAKIWSHQIDGDKLTLSLLSPDGEENYPGDLQVSVTYSFIQGALKIEYFAVSNKKTAINLTNHAYFNLDGEPSADVTGQSLWIDSDYIVPTDEKLIPRGGFKAVKDTPFDFNVEKTIGADLYGDDEDLKRGNGYDHCYLLKTNGTKYARYATAYSDKTGIRMTCFTDMPAVQLYTGNFLDQQGKTTYYTARSGFCLETQAIPNNVNVPEYAQKGNSIYEADQEYRFVATYQFAIQ